MGAVKYVLKYPLSFQHDPELKVIMSKEAKIISLGMQEGVITAWAETPDYVSYDERTFVCVGTGFGFNSEEMEYVGTVFDGVFVWHIYEKKEIYI